MKIKKAYTISFMAIILLATSAFYTPTDKYFEIARNLDIFASLFK